MDTDQVRSADGTEIAVTRTGDGPPVVVVNGAMSTAADAAPIAAALAAAGFTAFTYDRRARGGSGDTPPSTPHREVEDLAAVVEAAGGSAAVLGHSSGAVLALYAASLGVPVTHLLLSEPPFSVDGGLPGDLPERIQALVDAGRPDEAVVLFQRDGVGLPEAMISELRAGPWFPALVALAQSCVYDAALVRDVGTPSTAMLAPPAPVTVLCGSPTFPDLERASRELADRVPHAELVVLSRSRDHRLDPQDAAEVAVRVLGRPPAELTGAADVTDQA